MRIARRSPIVAAGMGILAGSVLLAACWNQAARGPNGQPSASGGFYGGSGAGGTSEFAIATGSVEAGDGSYPIDSTAGPGSTVGVGSTAGPGSTAAASHGPGQSGNPTPTLKTTVTPSPSPTPGPTATPAPTAPPPPGTPCYVFPYSNVWNQPVDGLPVAGNSDAMVNAIGRSAYLHPDFDAIGDGIPINYVHASTPTYYPSFDYADESDPGPYPIPSGPLIEGGSDAHLIAVDVTACKLWELYAVSGSGSSWSAGSGAIWDLRSNALRPDGWTSADAAGLPIFPGLVRYDQVQAGEILHALRFTAPDACGHIYPARHQTAGACSNLPPMGLRVRLKASVDISRFGSNARVVLTALKKYGMILADNGSPWFVSGVPDDRWNDDEFHQLQTLHGSDFEVVDTSGLRNG